MHPKPLKSLLGLLTTAAMAFVLTGCNGKQGQQGPAGANGTNGSNGNNGATYALDISTLSADEWADLTLQASVTSVTMGSTPVVNFKVMDGHNVPVKGFGTFTSLPSTALYASYPNLGFSIAKLVPGAAGSPSRWVNYIVTSIPTKSVSTWTPGKPSTENQGQLKDNGDGTYTYTFKHDLTQIKAQLDAYTYTGNNLKADLGDVSYEPNLTHRLTLYVGGMARGTGDTTLGDRSANSADGTNTGKRGVYILNPANAVYDFIPATGSLVGPTSEQREITSVDKCFSCHSKFEFHAGGRQDTRYCVVCHTDQRKYGNPEATTTATGFSGNTYKVGGKAVGDFPTMVHKIHMGEELTKTNYNYANVLFNEITYPQDQRNCVKCHSASTATGQGDNWYKKPNRAACGACHDSVDFATGTNHALGGPQLNDQNCVNCHSEANIKLDHIPVVPPNPNNIYLGPPNGTNNNTNASFVAGFNGATDRGTLKNLPEGAKVPSWEIKSFTLTAAGKAQFVFRFLLDGVAVPFNNPATKAEFWDGFVGGPSFYVAFTQPQDGINYPADWNATFSTYFKNIWRGDGKDMTGAALAASAKATLTGPDSSGYYTLLFTDAIIPTNAGMIAGGIGFTYGLTATQPLTQVSGVVGPPWLPNLYAYNVEGKKQGGLSVPAPNVIKYVSGTLPAGFDTVQATTARRTIVETKRCNDCHGALGVFAAKSYHGGQRNDAQTCEFCHNGQRVNSGWGVNMKDFVHAIHGASKRVNKFSWESNAGFAYWKITYPSVLNNCEICHVPGSYDFGNTTNAGEVPNLNWTTVATGTTPTPMNVIVTGNETLPGVYWSQFAKDAAAAANAGNASGYNFGTAFSYSAATGTTTQSSTTTLVSSPYVAACSNCHDSTLAINHMKANGGTFYGTRASVQANPAAPVAGGALVNKEQCFVCHSAGKIADVRKVHMEFK